MLNQCTLAGRLAKDIEIRYTPNGKAVSNFTLAVPREYQNAQGEKETDFFNFVAWGKPAENMANHLSKGDMILVQSRAQTRSYDKDGQKVYVTEFVVETFPKYIKVKKWENGGQSSGTGSQQSNQPSHDPFAGSGPIEVNDDDLPF